MRCVRCNLVRYSEMCSETKPRETDQYSSDKGGNPCNSESNYSFRVKETLQRYKRREINTNITHL